MGSVKVPLMNYWPASYREPEEKPESGAGAGLWWARFDGTRSLLAAGHSGRRKAALEAHWLCGRAGNGERQLLSSAVLSTTITCCWTVR